MGAFEFIAYSKCAYYNRLDVAPLGSRPAGVGWAGASDVDVLAGEGSRCRISVTRGTSYNRIQTIRPGGVFSRVSESLCICIFASEEMAALVRALECDIVILL